MQCVRCMRNTAQKIAQAPDGSRAWELYFCETCHYSWRNSEPDFITEIEKRDSWAQIDAGDDFISIKEQPISEYKATRR